MCQKSASLANILACPQQVMEAYQFNLHQDILELLLTVNWELREESVTESFKKIFIDFLQIKRFFNSATDVIPNH
jgi:hypothetical protein